MIVYILNHFGLKFESFWRRVGVKCIFLKHENKVNTIGVTSNFGPPAGSKKWAPNLYLALYGLKMGPFLAPLSLGPSTAAGP